MKYVWLCCFMALTVLTSYAQLNSNGGRHAGFSIDADTKAGYAKYFPADTPYYHEDDWFADAAYGGRGRGVLDTTGAALLKQQLQGGQNLSFIKRMSQSPYAVMPYVPAGAASATEQVWVDAIYFRDYVDTDQTSFTTASKNGANPNTWKGGATSVGAKADIVDAYTHVRTTGRNPATDSVWFFAGVSTRGVNGSRYYDIEVYREKFSYDAATGNFSSAGTSNGHSEWEFDAAGNVTQTGDIIISVTFDNNGAPAIDFRIWVSQTTWSTVKPSNFKFTKNFYTSNKVNGYAEIVSNSGSSEWGSGLANYSKTPANDTTYASPWGTVNTGGAWSPHYEHLQFVEVALNFSRFGMNPFNYVTSFCQSPYSTIIIKSRAAASFDANLVDFVGPQEFTVKNIAPFTLTPDVLTCAKTSGQIIIDATARNYYRWKTQDGTLLQADSDATTFPVTAPGTYVVEATNFQGCGAMQTNSVVVAADWYKPVASISMGIKGAKQQLIGGNPNASNYNTPFGNSAGLLWNWTGPENFMATEQSPIVDPFVPGVYELTVTEKRNGCTDVARAYFFGTLSGEKLTLQAKAEKDRVQLWWQHPAPQQEWMFEAERSSDGVHYTTIGRLPAVRYHNAALVHTDHTPPTGTVYYRLKGRKSDGSTIYSNVVNLHLAADKQQVVATRLYNQLKVAVANSPAGKTDIRLVDTNGALLLQQTIPNPNGQLQTTLTLPAAAVHKPLIVLVTVNGAVIGTQKL